MAEDSQLLLAQAKKYFREASDLTIRSRLWLAMMEEYGVIEYNADGFDANWDVVYAQPEFSQYGDDDDVTFSNHRALKQATIDIRGYVGTDKLTLKQSLMNRGEGAIVKLLSNKAKQLVKAARDTMAGELYVDGNATGNTNRFHGILSFMGAGTCAATDRVAKCNDTYAGLSTVQANYGGTWSSDLGTGNYPNATLATDWPDGKGDSKYDFFSPILANYSSTAWPSGGTTWADNCVDTLRAVAGWLRVNTGDEDVPVCFLLDKKMMRDFKTNRDPTLRTLVPHKASQDLGFEDVLTFEGCALKAEYNATAGVGYAVTTSMMEMFLLTDSLFDDNDSPKKDWETGNYLFKLHNFGNMRFQPKYFAQLKAIA